MTTQQENKNMQQKLNIGYTEFIKQQKSSEWYKELANSEFERSVELNARWSIMNDEEKLEYTNDATLFPENANFTDDQRANILKRILNNEADYTVQSTDYTNRVVRIIDSTDPCAKEIVEEAIDMDNLLFIQDNRSYSFYNKFSVELAIEITTITDSLESGIIVSKGLTEVNCAELDYCENYGMTNSSYKILSDGSLIRILFYATESG